jgi:hypothetical protein
MTTENSKRTEGKMKTEIKLYCDPELKRLLGRRSDVAELPLSDFIVKVMAEYIDHPELAKIPRKKMGRPCLKRPEPANIPRKKLGRPRVDHAAAS